MNNSVEQVYFKSLPNNLKVMTVVDNDTFKVEIVENNKVWSGSLSFDEIKIFAESLGTPITDYWKDIKSALTTHCEAGYKSYQIENGYFICRKEIKNTNMKSIVFKIKLTEKNSDGINIMIHNLIEQNIKLQANLDKIVLSHKEISEANEGLKHKLEKSYKIKNDMETDLYGKFTVLLNSKKRKLQEYQNSIKSHDTALSKNQSEEYFQMQHSSEGFTSEEGNVNQDEFLEINSQHSVDDIECVIPKNKSFRPGHSIAQLDRRSKRVSKQLPASSSTVEHLDAQDLLDEF